LANNHMTSLKHESQDREFELFQEMKQKSDEELHLVIVEKKCDEKRAAASQLTIRGGKANFKKAIEFCNSKNPYVRVEGAHILGQLGTPKRPFKMESTPILINLLEHDSNENVRASAAAALGHIENPEVVPILVKHVADPSEQVRHDLAFALGCYSMPEVIDPLIALSNDPNQAVRSWATFGLGTCIELDNKKIREALYARLSDIDPEVRGEALIGLAERKDPRVIENIKKELSGKFYGNWAIEAAGIIKEPSFVLLLESLRERIIHEVEERFIEDIDNAIKSCGSDKII
jgi:HEAT repeat protein